MSTCCVCRSTSVCANEVSAVWYCRNDYGSKILLLFNLLFFINKFQLAISRDHHFASITIVDLFFFLLDMQVNVNQYLAAIGMFNNRSSVATKKSFCVTETNSVRKMFLPFLAINTAVLFFFLFFFMFTVYFHQKYRKYRS